MSKTLLYIVIFISSTYFGLGQEGQISIEQDKKISDLLELYKGNNSSSDMYRIQVFFGSYQGAERVKSQVEVDFPGWYSKIDFESPSYRVRVGRFKTKLEAERKLIEVREKYPSAVLLKPEKTTR